MILNKPISLAFSFADHLLKYIFVEKAQENIIRNNLSDPFTFLLPFDTRNGKPFTSHYQNLDKITVRISNSELVINFIDGINLTIATTSANLSGHQSYWSAGEFLQ